MGKDKKKQLTRLLAFVKELYEHPDNKEFASGIREMVLGETGTERMSDETSDIIHDIYELCVRRFLSEQAEDMYKSFPLSGISGALSKLYIEMEHSRRKNDIDGFGFYLFRQLELITNTLVSDDGFARIYDAARLLKPFIRYDKVTGGNIRVDDKSTHTVEGFILIPNRSSDESKRYKSLGKPLKDLSALEKIRAVIYFVVLKAEVNVFHPQVLQDFSTLSSIYNLRNYYAHSGVTSSDVQNEYYLKIQDDKTQNSLKYLSFLLMFIQGVSDNYPLPDALYTLA
jgi:hypothetical protein